MNKKFSKSTLLTKNNNSKAQNKTTLIPKFSKRTLGTTEKHENLADIRYQMSEIKELLKQISK